MPLRRDGVSDLVGALDVTELGGLTVARVSFGTEITMQWRETGAYQVTLPLSGSYRAWQGRRPTAQVTPDLGFARARQPTPPSPTGPTTPTSAA
ncbi:hypothetical protein ACFY1U_19510 [Streptomyces sp. NPDC001351]|uniref:AraC-like ligand-binding domain-containing protein n=1 Tax=Streptomyces sp. NPDC001351 TaxID=3364564 RepID=UPI0036860CE6